MLELSVGGGEGILCGRECEEKTLVVERKHYAVHFRLVYLSDAYDTRDMS